MKIYISADIEGVAGIAAWEEARSSSASFPYFARQMTMEVAAACKGASNAGADEVWVKDAHGRGRNMDPSMLPENIRLIRGWSGHPYKMLHGIDETFHAIGFVGYHSHGGSNTNPLAHTISSTTIDHMKLNGEYMSEFLLHAYLASYLEIPIAFLSGDKGICEEARRFNENIVTVAVNEGVGASSISMHPNRAIRLIEKEMGNALRRDLSQNHVELPEHFKLEVAYNDHTGAYRYSFYPGARQNSPNSIVFETDDYYEIMRATSFLV